MNTQSYFTFSLNGDRYGIETAYVNEVFALPEITPLAEAAPDISGVINLRGDIVPILDLSVSLGRSKLDYQLTDSLIVLRGERLHVGIVVNEVNELVTLPIAEMEAIAEPKADSQRENVLLGVIGALSILRAPDDWLQPSEQQALLLSTSVATAQTPDADRLDAAVLYQPHLDTDASADRQKQEVFRRRAEYLRIPVAAQTPQNFRSFVVSAIGDVLLAVDVELVQEFIDVRKITPIPCCPPHIVGNVNLRGEILTVVDLCAPLELAASSSKIEGSAVMVVQIQGNAVGVAIDRVSNAAFSIPQDSITSAAESPDLIPIRAKYLQGVAPYEERCMGILDLHKLFASNELVVDVSV